VNARQEVVTALVTTAAAEASWSDDDKWDPDEPTGVAALATDEEFAEALEVLYNRMAQTARGARGVAMGASPWETTRRTRRQLNRAMPHIVDDVHALQAQIQYLQRLRASRFPPRTRRLASLWRRIGNR
jgi:hypothetical protein